MGGLEDWSHGLWAGVYNRNNIKTPVCDIMVGNVSGLAGFGVPCFERFHVQKRRSLRSAHPPSIISLPGLAVRLCTAVGSNLTRVVEGIRSSCIPNTRLWYNFRLGWIDQRLPKNAVDDGAVGQLCKTRDVLSERPRCGYPIGSACMNLGTKITLYGRNKRNHKSQTSSS